MKRYNCTLSDKRGAFGLCMEEHKEGMFVPFSEVERLQAANRKREQELAEQLADATRQGGVMAELLREARKYVTALGKPDDEISIVQMVVSRIDSALAGQVMEPVRNDALAMMMDELHDICVGLDAPGGAQNGAEAWDQVKCARDRVLTSMRQGRPDTEWTDATTSPVAADYRELQEQHDQLQSTHKGALDLLHELREGAEIHLHNCKVCKNEDGVNNWTGKLARIDAALAGKLPTKPVTITESIRTAPERIWLQVGDQSHYHSEPFPIDTSEVSWCADSVAACEVPYVRADLACQAPLRSSDQRLLDWAVTSWHEQVAHRPMENVYRRTLDSVWRQVIRFAGEDPHSIIGPSHDDLLYPEQAQEGGEPCATEPPLSSKA
ncbi:hypothetical protein AB2J22_13265 [Aeromonas sp. A5]|uniref:hypothetical protein n=1 Tax=unclassified Aeromonas TaxID=257493 RepID=UPI00376F7406